jgi:polar amino acid transport system substrate-binding protein
MKKLLVLVLAIAVMATMGSAATKKLTIVVEDKEDYPWMMGNGTQLVAGKPGAVAELMYAVGKKLGIEVVIVRSAWKRALEVDLASGTVDAIMPASYKKEREAFGVYPLKADGSIDTARRVLTYVYKLYALKGSSFKWDGTKPAAFNGKVGVVRGYSIVGDLKALGFQVEELESTDAVVRMLNAGRIDLMADLENKMTFYIETKKDYANVAPVDPPIVSKPAYLVFSKQFYSADKAMAELIWKTISDMIGSGELDRFARKYF